MNEATRSFVRQRAANRCEYCQTHQDDSPLASHHIEHIRPIKHGGDDHPDNLALACIDCNLHKGANLTGIDPRSGSITPLFHPREQSWHDHFRWEGLQILGLTDVGRTTVQVLRMNSEEQMELRMAQG